MAAAEAPKPKATRLDVEPTEELPGGRGRRIPLVGLRDGAKHLDVHVNVINADSGAGPTHLHKDSDDVYVVLEGEVKVWIGDRSYIGTPGDVLFIPAGTPHYAGATGGAPARVLEIYGPSIYRGPERDFHVVEDAPW